MLTRLLFAFLCFQMFLSCKNTANTSDKTDELADTNMVSQVMEESPCKFTTPDTAVAGIHLRDEQSIILILGKETQLSSDQTGTYYSADRKQALSLQVHPGDMANHVSLMKITHSENGSEKFKTLSPAVFETNNGIRLGMSQHDITGKLGTCYTVQDSTAEGMSILYMIALPNDSRTGLLARTNMPMYSASYTFKNDTLHQIQFGFEAP